MLGCGGSMVLDKESLPRPLSLAHLHLWAFTHESPSTWIDLHPNKLALRLQEPACKPPPPGRLLGPHPPLSPTSQCFSQHPSCGLTPPNRPRSAPIPHQPGGSEDSSPARPTAARSVCGAGRGGRRDLNPWLLKSGTWEVRGLPVSLHLSLPPDGAAAGRVAIPSGGAAKAEGVAGTRGPRGGP